MHSIETGKAPSVEYNILLSPTYQVPVLYFRLHDLPDDIPTELGFLYQQIVPRSSIDGLQQIGVMGAISSAVGGESKDVWSRAKHL